MANEHSQIVPSMQPTAKVADFKFWCQKVLPLVYDDSLSYYEVLNKMVVYLNQVIDNINADIDNIDELEDDFLLLQTYVNNFFDDIDQLVTYAERAEAAETSAIGYAANAAESASNSATSASNAAGSASSSATSALSAMDAKDAAVAAKTAAETALANAQTAATNAAASATTASGAAINAQTAASAASTSANLADTAAQTATSKASEAAASAATAEGVLESIPDDYTELSEQVETNTEDIVELREYVDETLEPITIDEAQYISIDDGIAEIPVSGRIIIDTIQQGTGAASSSNIRNIVPMETSVYFYLSGKNIYRYEPILRPDNSRYVTLRSGYTSGGVGSAVTLKPGEKIYVRISVSSSVGALWGVYGSWTDNRADQTLSALGTTLTRSFTITNSRDYTRGFGIWLFASSGGSFAGKTVTVMMTVDGYSDYEEHQLGNVYSSLPEALQSVICGGEFDLTTGELTVTRKFISSYNGEELPGFWLSSRDVYEEGTTPTIGAKVAYDLAEPETYQLDPINMTLYDGYNYIYNYYAHFEPFIYRKANNTAELIKLTKNIIAPVLNDMIADTALEENDFRIVNNTMYRITTNIAQGASLNPGTNCTATTVADILKTLLS